MPETTSTTVMTRAEWQAKARQLGDGDILDCRLECMSCHIVFTPRQFMDAGGKATLATQQCIGRAKARPDRLPTRPPGRKRKALKARYPAGKPQPCNWATYGLIVLDGLVTVIHPDGQEILVWPFADEYRPGA